jgi:sugar phosphate isomerase/epimerase
MQVNVSIGDFSPLLRGPEVLFRGLKEAGADGVELNLGIKSRWSVGYHKQLAKKYGLPIVSVHQPVWSMMGLLFDEGAFRVARELGARTITCHPLPRLRLDNERMKSYLRRLADIKKKTGLEVLIENLPLYYNHPIDARHAQPDHHAKEVAELYKVTQAVGLKLTLDTDHLQSPAPHTEKPMSHIWPHIRNIHLSSFEKGKRHLPLYAGQLQTADFILYLKSIQYDGLITLEIDDPAFTWHDYDFAPITKSIAMVKGHKY